MPTQNVRKRGWAFYVNLPDKKGGIRRYHKRLSTMANEIKLEVLTFGIREFREEKKAKNYKNLADIDGVDFFEEFKKYLGGIRTNLEAHEMLKVALRLKRKTLIRNSSKRTYRGVIDSGHYGIESEIENLNTRKIKRKQLDDVEKMPFYFLISIPKKLNVGILILQRFGIFGITTVFKSSLTNFVKTRFPNLTIDFNPLITPELAKEFATKGGVKEIIFTRYNLPSDKVDLLGLTKYESSILSIEIHIKAKRNMFLSSLRDIRKRVADPNTAFLDSKEIKGLGFDGNHKIQVVSNASGVRRKIDLSETGQIRPYYDIDEQVKKEKSGYPSFKSIDEIAVGMLKDFKQ